MTARLAGPRYFSRAPLVARRPLAARQAGRSLPAGQLNGRRAVAKEQRQANPLRFTSQTHNKQPMTSSRETRDTTISCTRAFCCHHDGGGSSSPLRYGYCCLVLLFSVLASLPHELPFCLYFSCCATTVWSPLQQMQWQPPPMNREESPAKRREIELRSWNE